MTAKDAASGRAAGSRVRARLTLDVAAGAAAQQRALDAWATTAPAPRAALVEGGFHDLESPPETTVARLAPGCVCCVGSVPMRVALTRLLRQQRPASVLLLIAANTHRERVERMLTSAPLDAAVEIVTGPAACS